MHEPWLPEMLKVNGVVCAGGYGGESVRSGPVPECLQPHDHSVRNRERMAPIFGSKRDCLVERREGSWVGSM
uniref:Uncharacterized protein n=1 Tax=Setaria italica TaxID=4555 RepID=K3ZKT1_SETIT